MSDGFWTQTGTMESVATQFDGVNAALKSRFETLKNDMLATRGKWVGQSASEFVKLMLNYDDKAQKLNTALKNIATQLHEDGKDYTAQQVQDAQQLSPINQMLG